MSGSGTRLPLKKARVERATRNAAAAVAPVPASELAPIPLPIPVRRPVSRRDTVRRRTLALADVAGLLLAYAFTLLVTGATAQPLLLIALPAWVLLNKLLGLYDRDDMVLHKSTLDEMPKLTHSITTGTALVFLLGPLVAEIGLGRADTVVYWFAALVAVPLLRATGRHVVRHHAEPERCIVVGSGSVATVLARKIAAHPEHGVELVGCIDDSRRKKRHAGGPPLLGTVADFTAVCEEHGIERVLIAFSGTSHEAMLETVRAAKRLRLKVSVVPRLYEITGAGLTVDQIEGMTMLTLRGMDRSRSSLALKRTIDVLGAGFGLLLLSPLFAAVALAIKLTSRGPVIYSQDRVGRDSHFRIHKFRTMVTGADELKETLVHLNEATGPMFKIASDPRITRVGRFLRKTSIDELPQLWNVLRGDMSLVGPRPLVPDEDDHITDWRRSRLELTPGLTGPWQVAGRTAVPFEEMVNMDYLYVMEWSLFNDIKLLLRTAPAVFFARGH